MAMAAGSGSPVRAPWIHPEQLAGLNALVERLEVSETLKGAGSPIGRFGGIVEQAAPIGSDASARRRRAATALAALGCREGLAPAGLDAYVERLRTVPVEQIVLVWAVLEADRSSPRASGVATAAERLVLGELCFWCRLTAGRLRRWSALPGHADDTEGIVWAAFAFPRLTGGCDCAGGRCRRPAIHELASWLEPATHERRKGASAYFDLRSWLERACCGHSPAFKPVGTFTQGLIAVCDPDLIEGSAAMRRCGSGRCPPSPRPRPVALGRTCPECGQVPGGAVRMVRKVVNRRSWTRWRFRRCGQDGGEADEHFLELALRRCPECGWAAPAAADHQECRCGLRFRLEEAACPSCGRAAVRASGLVGAWVHAPPPEHRTARPGVRRRPPFAELPAAVQDRAPDRTPGLSPAAVELLAALWQQGGMLGRRVREFLWALKPLLPAWRGEDEAAGPPSPAQERAARRALQRLSVRLTDPQEAALLGEELERLVAAGHDDVDESWEWRTRT